MDLGQTVVVKDRAAVALEAMEGTDEVIRRAGRHRGRRVRGGEGGEAAQDMRFDVPVVGPGTLEAMRRSRRRASWPWRRAARCSSTGRVLLAEADAAGVAVWGMEREGRR